MKEFIVRISNKLQPGRLKARLIIIILCLVFFQITIIGVVSILTISWITEEQIGTRALKVSQTVSLIPEIRRLLIQKDPEHKIQTIAEAIRRETGAEFVVVGDHEAKRYSHPVHGRLGEHMVGGDSRRALETGESYISKAVGTLGPSIRGKVPILDKDGGIVGIVSVGYLLEDVKTIIGRYQLIIIALIPFLLLIGGIAASSIANKVKKAILDLEPDEIARLLQERTATLETVREGIVAVDALGRVTTINKAAFQIIGLQSDDKVLGKAILEVLPESEMMSVLTTGDHHFDRELLVDDEEIIVNRIPIKSGCNITGAVASFRRKNELERLSQRLTQMEAYAKLLRTQTHEYSNKLYTISGLVQIGHYQKAIDLISSETSGYQYMINFLMQVVTDPILAGLILGKYSRARELNITFTIDPDSSMSDIPDHVSRDRLVTIVGNIIDNAFEAVLFLDLPRRVVRLSMTDLGNDLVFELDDSGRGIDEAHYDRIFTMDYSTKDEKNHGTGLYLVDRALKKTGGSVTVSQSDLGGAAFTVIIPKQKRGCHGSHPGIDSRR